MSDKELRELTPEVLAIAMTNLTLPERIDVADAFLKAYDKRTTAKVTEARIKDNHDWDAETFKPVIVCKRCATTFQTSGNKPCKGKMAKVEPRATLQSQEVQE